MTESKSLLERQNPFKEHNINIFFICIALSVIGIHHNGAAALLQIVLCTLSAVICEFISFKIILKKNTLRDMSAVTTGMLIALMLPATAPLYVGMLASVFAILVAKLPFGDMRNTPFVPAGAGFCFAASLFSKEVFTYSAHTDEFFFFGSEGFTKASSLLDMLSTGDSINLNVFSRVSLFSGSYPGAIGTTSLFALLGVFAFICLREKKIIYPFFGFIASTGVFAFLFPRVSSGRLTSVVMELCAGSLIFTALLLITDPVTSPKAPKKAFIYGLTAGALCMLLRYFSKTPDPCCFTVLLMNALKPVLFAEKPKAVKPTVVKTPKLRKKEGADK